MAFPTQSLPNGDTFNYRDVTSGRRWVHDNAVWTPREPTALGDLQDVWTIGDTTSTIQAVRTIPRATTTPVPLTAGNTRANNVMFQCVCGEDTKVSSITLTGIYRDASMTNGAIYVYFIKGDLASQGATDGIVDTTTFDSYFNTIRDFARGFSYTSIPTTPGNNTTASAFSSLYNINTTVRAGEPFWIGITTGNTTLNGDFYYDEIPGRGITVNGQVLSGAPVEYSKLQWSASGYSPTSGRRWISDRPDHKAPYNSVTRQTVDPTPADLSSHQVGTYWLNTTTGRVWVHASSSEGFDGALADAKWIQFPVYNEYKVKPAIAQIRNGETDPYIVPPLEGEFIVDTATNQLKLYDGTSWIVL